jgi:hypothetical protein
MAAIDIKFYQITCPTCGIFFALEYEYAARRAKDMKAYYCPNAHIMAWSKSTNLNAKQNPEPDVIIPDFRKLKIKEESQEDK